jgi:hypothetical protein
VGTDIYGAIEIRDLIGAAALDDLLGAASPREAPWVHGIDLYPLYPGGDYAPLGCLFGIRNWNGWEPVAEGRGLPTDVSEAVREDYERLADIDAALGCGTGVVGRRGGPGTVSGSRGCVASFTAGVVSVMTCRFLDRRMRRLLAQTHARFRRS